MKKIALFPFVAVLLLVLSLNSCDKSESNSNEDGFLSSFTNTTISGIVFDENHMPVNGAKVMAHGYTKYTDQNGTFLFARITVPKNKCFVSVSYNNYFSVMRSQKPEAGGVTRMDAHLLSKSDGNTDVFPTGSLYTAFLSDGSSLEFPASTEFVDHLGNPYSGNVNLNTYVLDPSTTAYSRHAPGGDQIGIDAYEEQLLDAYTGTMVEISDDNGQPLQLASNTTPVNMVQQIPAALQAFAPNNIDVYFSSTSYAYNKREGDADKNGSQFESTVGHFTYWSTQVANPEYGILQCRVIDASGNRLAGVRVQVGKAYGITDENGMFERKVPVGLAMDVAIRPLDFYGFSVVSAQSAWANDEIRFVELQLPQDIDHVQGQLIDCYGQPVEGLLTLNWNSNVSSVYTQNGTFDLLVLSGFFSYELNIQTEIKDTSIIVDVQAGLTDLGDVSLCAGIELPTTNNYVRIDTNGVIRSEYYQFDATDGHVYIDPQTSEVMETYIEVSGIDGTISLYLPHINTAGTYDITSDNLSISFLFGTSDSYYLQTGTLNITDFEQVGGLIKGIVTGMTSNNEEVYIEFEVHRTADVLSGI